MAWCKFLPSSTLPIIPPVQCSLDPSEQSRFQPRSCQSVKKLSKAQLLKNEMINYKVKSRQLQYVLKLSTRKVYCQLCNLLKKNIFFLFRLEKLVPCMNLSHSCDVRRVTRQHKEKFCKWQLNLENQDWKNRPVIWPVCHLLMASQPW